MTDTVFIILIPVNFPLPEVSHNILFRYAINNHSYFFEFLLCFHILSFRLIFSLSKSVMALVCKDNEEKRQ